MREPVAGAGHSVASVDGPDEGYGFREVHKELGVGDLGVDAIVVPAGSSPDFTRIARPATER